MSSQTPRATRSDRDAAQALLVTFARLGAIVTEELRAQVPGTTGNVDILVLTTLDVHGPKRPTDLQAVTFMTSGGMTKLLDRLEESGLVSRTHGLVDDDRRAIVVSITPEGSRVAERMTLAVMSVMGAVREAADSLRAIVDNADPAPEDVAQDG
jgi:DNA-binding MarR family transcriptional regulator